MGGRGREGGGASSQRWETALTAHDGVSPFYAMVVEGSEPRCEVCLPFRPRRTRLTICVRCRRVRRWVDVDFCDECGMGPLCPQCEAIHVGGHGGLGTACDYAQGLDRNLGREPTLQDTKARTRPPRPRSPRCEVCDRPSRSEIACRRCDIVVCGHCRRTGSTCVCPYYEDELIGALPQYHVGSGSLPPVDTPPRSSLPHGGRMIHDSRGVNLLDLSGVGAITMSLEGRLELDRQEGDMFVPSAACSQVL